MSIQLRDQVKHLQARQAIYSRQRAWWTSDGHPQALLQQPPSAQANASVPPGPHSPSPQPLMMVQRAEVDARVEVPQHQLPSMAMPQALNLQQELSAAMSSEMPSSSAVVFIQQFHVTKTSETHPIKYVSLLSTLLSIATHRAQHDPGIQHIHGHSFRVSSDAAKSTVRHSQVIPLLILPSEKLPHGPGDAHSSPRCAYMRVCVPVRAER